MTGLEILATITGVIGVALQAKEKIVAWPFAIVSVSILAFIFFNERLYSDFGLHIIYIFLNIYGWIIWSKRKNNSEIITTNLLSFKGLYLSVALTILLTLLLGYIMTNNTDADLPYFDAFTTGGSLVGQYLLAKKYLQNWFFWIVVDVVAIPVYIYKELYIVAFLFFIFLGLSIWGYISWKKYMTLQRKLFI